MEATAAVVHQHVVFGVGSSAHSLAPAHAFPRCHPSSLHCKPAVRRCVFERGEEDDRCKFYQRAFKSLCPPEWVSDGSGRGKGDGQGPAGAAAGQGRHGQQGCSCCSVTSGSCVLCLLALCGEVAAELWQRWPGQGRVGSIC